ncbi:MAG: DUF2784 domain-containing protein [Thermoguttaceae bacterium]|jgi:hypothetical protein
MWYRLLADLIVLVHFAYVAFVLLGMAAILAGIVRRWQWIGNFWFRLLHFLAIALVAAEALLGITCPLTDWEDRLRTAAGDTGQAGSFVGRWVHALMFCDAPEWVFTACYCLFALAVLVTLVLAPPRRPRRRRGTKR